MSAKTLAALAWLTELAEETRASCTGGPDNDQIDPADEKHVAKVEAHVAVIAARLRDPEREACEHCGDSRCEQPWIGCPDCPHAKHYAGSCVECDCMCLTGGSPDTERESDVHDCETWAMEGIACARCNPIGVPCPWCANGDEPIRVDKNGVSADDGQLAHTSGDSWWPCLGTPPVLAATVTEIEALDSALFLLQQMIDDPKVRGVEDMGALRGLRARLVAVLAEPPEGDEHPEDREPHSRYKAGYIDGYEASKRAHTPMVPSGRVGYGGQPLDDLNDHAISDAPPTHGDGEQ